MWKSLILAAILFMMAGCPEASTPPRPPQPNVTEELLRKEKELRAQAEARRDNERASKEAWQALTAFAAICAVLLLIAGTALGSRTRHDAERRE